jgi:transposase-like protein
MGIKTTCQEHQPKNRNMGKKKNNVVIQAQIKALVNAGTSVRNTAKVLHISTRTARKYKKENINTPYSMNDRHPFRSYRGNQ